MNQLGHKTVSQNKKRDSVDQKRVGLSGVRVVIFRLLSDLRLES